MDDLELLHLVQVVGLCLFLVVLRLILVVLQLILVVLCLILVVLCVVFIVLSTMDDLELLHSVQVVQR